MEKPGETLIRLADTLVERGFAECHRLDLAEGADEFRWTPTGEELRAHLNRLFDIPNTPLSAIAADDISAVIALILLTAPR